MALIFKDRVRQLILATGTGDLTLNSPVASYTNFNDANLGNNLFPYAIVNASQFEVGIGQFITPGNSSTTFGVITRVTVLSNSNLDTSFINFDGSPASVVITNSAELSILTSTQPASNTKKIIKWIDSEYKLVDQINNATTLGAGINSSLTFYNASTTNLEADPNIKFFPGQVPELWINGVIQATAKSFKIIHPCKANKYLIHGSLEGPEHGVYLRGSIITHYKHEVFLPDYFQVLANTQNYTVCVSSNSFIPVKVKKYANKIQIKLLLPSPSPVEIDYFVVANRTDIQFNLEV